MLTQDEILNIREDMGDENDRLSDVFKALSGPIRCKMFELISKTSEALCVSDIATYFDLSLSATSQKLRILEVHGLLERYRDGKEVYFKVKDDPTVISMMEIIKKLREKNENHINRMCV